MKRDNTGARKQEARELVITVVGAGYVGQVMAIGLANIGNQVRLADKNSEIISALRDGRSHLSEDGLLEELGRALGSGALHLGTDLIQAVGGSDIVVIAVGTPVGQDGTVHLQDIRQVVRQIAGAINPGTIVLTKSTVPVGTNAGMGEIIEGIRGVRDFHVVSCPEFLREGEAIHDFFNQKRIIIGYNGEAGDGGDRYAPIRERILGMFRYFVEKDIPLFWCKTETAELAKYASNAFLATRVSLMNQFADLAERYNADIREIGRFLALDERLGTVAAQAGPGFGGSCLPKDCRAVAGLGRAGGSPMTIIEEVLKSNKRQQLGIIDKLRRALGTRGRRFGGKNIAILGLAFKANTNDTRESPAIPVITTLLQQRATVRVYDPQGMETIKAHLDAGEVGRRAKRLVYCKDALDALSGTDALIILTEWAEFSEIPLGEIRGRMRTPIIIDMRNILKRELVEAAGIMYYGIGT